MQTSSRWPEIARIASKIENISRIAPLVELVKSFNVGFSVTHPAWGYDPRERNLEREIFFINAIGLLNVLPASKVLFVYSKEKEKALAEAKFRSLGTDISKFPCVFSLSGHLFGECVDGWQEKASGLIVNSDIILQGGFYRGGCAGDTMDDLEKIAEIIVKKSIFVVTNSLVCKRDIDVVPSMEARVSYRIAEGEFD
ncbi:MAG: hypothetical protein NTX79_00310 [Candidatus Micrarchaeota archaeon]|nr:hypothetical protein [Candidatus Micrarchaeota archaeon]